MKNAKLILLFVLAATVAAFAQKLKATPVPLTADAWTFSPQKVEFVTEDGVPAMKILPDAGQVVAKSVDFSSGTIEFDIKLVNPIFDSFHFRMKDAGEGECFYFRNERAGDPEANDAVQYAPVLGGATLWDVFPQYQAAAGFSREGWTHVKLVISGAQMRVYVNNPAQPILEVPQLEGNTTGGTIAFAGEALVSNLVLRPGQVEDLPAAPGIDFTRNDPRYIRNWAVSEPITTPAKLDFSHDFLPTPETAWQVVEAERRGLVNLTRLFGQSNERRFTWLKVKITAATAGRQKVDFGFKDEVWVFLNGKLAYLDKNLEAQPIMKEPQGRCAVENTSFVLPLRQGDNELLIGVADWLFGWGIIARLENAEGLKITPDPTFDARLVKISGQLLDAYAGCYLLPDGKAVTLTREKDAIKISGEGLPNAVCYPRAENRFFIRDTDLEMEFRRDNADQVSNLVLYAEGKPVLDAKRAN
jgi:hypothetical protein